MAQALDEALSPSEQKTLDRDWRLFTALIFCFTFGFTMYSGPFQNFLKDALHAHELDLGILESTREIPGLLAALMAGTLVALAETRVAALGLLISAFGIAATGLFHSLPPVIAITVFWSIGFHLFTTVQSAITLALAKGKEGGRHLGRMSGVGAVSTLFALGLALVLSKFLSKDSYWVYFALGGVAILIATVLCLMLSSHAHGGKRQRIVLRKEYGLYYFLIFLEGCRRQIFSIFASFALILIYKVPVSRMLALQFINAILIMVTAPAMGRLIDKKGERGPLSFYAIGLIVVFLGYATFQNVGALYALFLIDNILFTFGVGFTTYLHRIARPGELTPCLAMGTTMNHIASVTVPVLGALLWKHTGNYQYPFWVGVGIAGLSLIATRWLPKHVAAEAV